ncbi:FtsX-like permease family protein [Fulvivirga sp. M361]|uniref:ABC transporter permease n=1 Tax=Fulvivirga sp. M361 TaxID=2594266 RepID=UPI001179C9BE|nr:ABC transporter permease [Fulvivirga sp. M361]TRX57541.1 FtsX-like permease family protein [Fulvivirga sp. M361]
MNQLPPNWISKVLGRICPAHMCDEIEGDLFEYYAELCEKKNRRYANRKAFVFLILSAPGLIVKRKYHPPNSIDMLKNYLLIAIRNIRRQLGYSTINVVGLAIGLACCIFIGVYVVQELSFDKFHKQAEAIFRVNISYETAGASGKSYTTPTALLPSLRRDNSKVATGVRVFNVSMFSPVVVQKENTKYQEERFLYADSSFFDVFSFEMLAGDPAKALAAPRSVILTASSAKKYFNDEDPLGQVIKVDGDDYSITGVLSDVPDNSHMKFDFLASFSSLRASQRETWWSANYATYLVLTDPDLAKEVESDIHDLYVKNLGDQLGDVKMGFDLMPLTDIHLRSDIPSEMQPQSDIRYIYIISAVGLLILIIACINYMNLATARSAERAREVGMRKVLGALRKQVFYQFMGESIIITTLSLIIAMVMVSIFLGPFNHLTGKQLVFQDILSGPVIIGLLIIAVFVSFFAGAYPAISLSSYAPGQVLKGSFKRSVQGSWMRKVLVGVQFSISIFLIIGTLVIYKQLQFMRNKKLGYTTENVLILPTDNVVNQNFDRIKTQLERMEDVVSVSSASESPTDIGGGYALSVPGYVDEPMNVQAITVEKDFIETMNMEMLFGRDLTDADHKQATLEESSDRRFSFIVNQELTKTLMIAPEDIIGQQVNLNGRQGEIVGILNDFHFTSLHRKIGPLLLFIEPRQFNKIFIRIQPDDLQKTLLSIEDLWKQIVPDRPFVFDFMDDEYNAMYRNEMRLNQVFITFSILAILIACLGLFGLVSFSVEQRAKEIGVRKVLGASVASLFFLVSRDFSRLVLISFLVAGPLSYWLMTQWLNDFEYRTSVGFLPLVVAVSCAIVVAFLTVSYQSLKAANMNPAETLRSE